MSQGRDLSTRFIERPNINDLTFQVFDRPVHPEFFDSLCWHDVAGVGFQLSIAITPAGHMLHWRRNKQSIVETICRHDDPLPEHGELFSHRFGQERSETLEPHAGVTYQTCFQVEKLLLATFQQVTNDLLFEAEKTGVIYNFRPTNRMKMAPLGYVDLLSRPGSVIANSFHTFPEELTVIKVQTLIDFPTE